MDEKKYEFTVKALDSRKRVISSDSIDVTIEKSIAPISTPSPSPSVSASPSASPSPSVVASPSPEVSSSITSSAF